ncbi:MULTISPECIES: RteC domain-containing protein [Chryseobacterium]|uniref:RteC domain-containing protein n=1 Tax=Chryseobacterium TaxID=59732 RepID=UPI000E742A0C|nr:RteC domain-containing protein [Chryseobacterium sp. AG363]RKE81608.1 RteC protein [Chryseobacterium sp. AG363]
MEIQLFFKKCKELQTELDKKLEMIDSAHSEDRIGACEKSLMEIDTAIRLIKSMVGRLEFSSIADEIYFFKELKPLFISRFIYYSNLLAIEAAKPNAGQASLKEYYNCELQLIKDFYQQHIDFYEYYRRKAAFLDQKYFVRNQFDLKTKLQSGLYNYDEKFATSHDHLIAQILANDLLEKYLLKSISQTEGYIFEKVTDRSPLNWSASKSGLVELLYALHQTCCFNGGNIEFSEVIRFTEKSLNVNLGNFYKTLHEIKSRKINRTKFLKLLNDNLNQFFTDCDQ